MFKSLVISAANGVSNLLGLLTENIDTNSRKFSKVGGRTTSSRQVFDQFLNRQRKLVNDEREVKGLPKISQYDAARLVANGEHPVTPKDLYSFGDRLCDVLGASGRPDDETIKTALVICAEDWASDVNNTHVSREDLFEDAEIASADIEASIDEI